MTKLIGQSLGRYHILEQLGEGGMAVVYKAFDTRLERNVAIKVILSGKDHSEKFLKRFEREAKALAGLSHPNIVKVLDYGENEGVPYLVMEYLHGGTLKQKLTGKPVSWSDAIRIVIPIARALGYAHEHKIVHRDIKPSNILITEAGDPMVSDFGIAKILEVDETLDLTGTGVGLGTPEYMSPEQAQGKQVDARSDIYSLGVVLYELVTGRKPYQADTPMAVVWKLASEPLPRPTIYNKDLPEIAEHVLLKALAKNPDDRFFDANAFITSLENAASAIRGVKGSDEGKKRSTSYRLVTGILGAIMVLGLLSYLVFNRQDSNLPPALFTSTSTSAVPPETHSITSTPTNISTDPTIHDDFSEAAYNGTFSRLKWETTGDCSSVSQEDGSLVFRNKNKGCDLIIHSMNSRFTYISNPSWLEAKVRVENDFQGNVATQELQFITEDLPGNSYWILCGIQVDQQGPRLFFDVNNYGMNKEAEYRQEMPAEAGRWYDFRLEIDSETGTTSCSVDGKVLGSYVPSDIELLLKARFKRIVEAARFPSTSLTSSVDDIRISSMNLAVPTDIPLVSSDLYLMDITPRDARAEQNYLGYGVYPWSEGPMSKGEPMFIMGRFLDHSIFAHAASTLTYDLGGKYQRLKTQVYYFGPCQPIVDAAIFRIFADNKLLYESPPLVYGDDAIPVEVSLAGVDQLILATDPMSNVSCDWTIWIEPILVQ